MAAIVVIGNRDKGKGLAGSIASKIPPPGKRDEGGDEPEDDSDDSIGLESALGDLWAAMKAGDMAGAARAFREAQEMCANGEPPTDEDRGY
jgi:hypothetical protein